MIIGEGYIRDKPKLAWIKQINVDSDVQSVSFSPDRKRVVSGSRTNVCVWDSVNGGLVVGPFEGFSLGVTFSNDAKYIASGNCDDTISIWDALSGRGIHTALLGHTEKVNSVAFSPDSKYIASCSSDGTIRVWDVEKGMEIWEPLRQHSKGVFTVLFSPNGVYLASNSYDEIIVWEVESRERKYLSLGGCSAVLSIAFSYDSSKIVSGSSDELIRLWDVSKGNVLREFSGSGMKVVNSVAYSPDDKHVLSGSEDGDIRMWDAENSEISPKIFRGHTGGVSSISYSPDGTHFVSGSWDGTVRIWDIKGETESN